MLRRVSTSRSPIPSLAIRRRAYGTKVTFCLDIVPLAVFCEREEGARGMNVFSAWRRLGSGVTGRCFIAALAAGTVLLGAPAALASTYERRPVLFVHGVESAGSNFASQAMRFESNGYPHGWVEALDYDSVGAAGTNYGGE